MAYLLRAINMPRWIPESGVQWLKEAEAPADILKDFTTKNNTLSVWAVDENLTRLDHILVALAANKSEPDHIEYVLFSDSIPEQAGVTVEHIEGKLIDGSVNKWHRDLVCLTAEQVGVLATFVWCSPLTQRNTVLKDTIARGIAQAVRDRRIALNRLNKKWRPIVEALLAEG